MDTRDRPRLTREQAIAILKGPNAKEYIKQHHEAIGLKKKK